VRARLKMITLAAVASAGLAATAAAAPAMGATPVSTGHSGWSWGSPSPQGQDLAALAFQGSTGYAVGAFGTVLRSDDAGTTWTGLASGTTDGLDLVQELSPTTVVVGGACVVRESTDGGATFRELPLGLGCDDPVAGLSFSDPTHGYVELHDGTLLFTDDGGATLQARTSPPLAGGSASGLAFTSPTTGVAISTSGAIARTTDGGNSWTQVLQSPFGLTGVTFVGPQIGYAVGSAGQLERSTDGGVTWTSQPLTIAGDATRPSLRSITCADANNCLITTVDSNQLVRTTDGGLTGAQVSVSDDALAAAAFTTGENVVGVGDDGATVQSSDGGQTFAVTSSDPLTGFTATGGLRAGGAAGTAYLPGALGRIAASVDGGQSWSVIRVPTSASIRDVGFATPSVGFALDTGGVLRRTDDGGMSWRSFAGTHSPASDLAVPSTGVQLLVGPRGIFRSTDGGASFHRVRGTALVRHGHGRPVGSLRLDHAVVASGRTLVWGQSGIFVSSTAGRTWRAVPAPVKPAQLASVSLAGAGHLWAASLTGATYSTADGGRKWKRADSVGDLGRAFTVSFSSARDGLVVLDGVGPVAPFNETSVLATHDGGETWEPQVVANPSRVPADILATPASDYLVSSGVDDEPEMFSTQNGGVSPQATTLRISLAHARQSAAALAHARHRVLLTGRVSPVLSADEQVAVSTTDTRGHRHLLFARVATGGRFRVTLTKVSSSLDIVGQVVGDGLHGGAGTKVSRFTVTR
jgi:photosystem II stability/assembly factor-like uncharacterized protein